MNFSDELPLSPLHSNDGCWLIKSNDRITSIVVESTKEGLRVFDNPVGVLTNNPTFDYQYCCFPRFS
ncbi:linear amide C-N hydrolase [Enterococcus faecalis]|uniref:linear amide C-N hydrolase n=1 Tax=Enterococcus faecalis TaxID=1351 RepID=UPI003DA07DBB